jgi:hypothetical protein
VSYFRVSVQGFTPLPFRVILFLIRVIRVDLAFLLLYRKHSAIRIIGISADASCQMRTASAVYSAAQAEIRRAPQ